MSQPPLRRKLVIVGDGACGKTSLLCCFALGEFPKEYHPTIFENYVAEIRLDGKPVQLALWDTAGQEEYEQLRPLSYAKSHVILIAFAIDTPDTLENVITKWIDEVRLHCGNSVPVLLVGCKSDLRPSAANVGSPGTGTGESTASGSATGTGTGSSVTANGGGAYVTTEQGKRVAQQIGAREYKECSALKVEGVDDVFEAATRASMLLRDHGRGHGGGAGSGAGRKMKRESRRDDDDSGRCCVVV